MSYPSGAFSGGQPVGPPNTSEIRDYGHAAGGTFYYAMEFSPGLTRAELVSSEGLIPPGRVIHILKQACESLKEAHEFGLVVKRVQGGATLPAAGEAGEQGPAGG